MATSAQEEAASKPDPKPKGLFAKLRRNTNSGVATSTPLTGEDGAQETGPATVEGDVATTRSTDDTAPAPASTATGSGLTGAELSAKWDEVITQAKARKTMMQKLKRLTSKEGKQKGKSRGEGGEIEIQDAVDSDPTSITPPGTGNVPGTNTLSRRIQVMLSAMPPFLNTLPDDTTTAPPSTSTPAAAPTAPQAPPLTDAKLLSFLSNTRVMNGNSKDQTPKTGPKRTVWQILDQLVPYKPPVASTQTDDSTVTAEATDTSLMVIGPLIPTAESKVEIAQYRVIDVETPAALVEDEKVVAKGVFQSLFPQNLHVRWPWWRRRGDPDCTPPDDTPPPPPPPKPTQPVKVWTPSLTAVSFQVAWWGYRIWLPEPVMSILSDKAIEATKRAAMVTTAIAWIVSNIPTASLPAPLAGAVILLKAVVPFIGYIGGFIAWSWGEVKGFDDGKGVVLSATWLLPIALIPGTWETVQERVPVGPGSEVPAPTPPATGTGTPPPASPPPSNQTAAPPPS